MPDDEKDFSLELEQEDYSDLIRAVKGEEEPPKVEEPPADEGGAEDEETAEGGEAESPEEKETEEEKPEVKAKDEDEDLTQAERSRLGRRVKKQSDEIAELKAMVREQNELIKSLAMPKESRDENPAGDVELFSAEEAEDLASKKDIPEIIERYEQTKAARENRYQTEFSDAFYAESQAAGLDKEEALAVVAEFEKNHMGRVRTNNAKSDAAILFRDARAGYLAAEIARLKGAPVEKKSPFTGKGKDKAPLGGPVLGKSESPPKKPVKLQGAEAGLAAYLMENGMSEDDIRNSVAG